MSELVKEHVIVMRDPDDQVEIITGDTAGDVFIGEKGAQAAELMVKGLTVDLPQGWTLAVKELLPALEIQRLSYEIAQGYDLETNEEIITDYGNASHGH